MNLLSNQTFPFPFLRFQDLALFPNFNETATRPRAFLKQPPFPTNFQDLCASITAGCTCDSSSLTIQCVFDEICIDDPTYCRNGLICQEGEINMRYERDPNVGFKRVYTEEISILTKGSEYSGYRWSSSENECSVSVGYLGVQYCCNSCSICGSDEFGQLSIVDCTNIQANAVENRCSDSTIPGSRLLDPCPAPFVKPSQARQCLNCCPGGATVTAWNDGGETQTKNNCYNYATNSRSNTYAQPGSATTGKIKKNEYQCDGNDPYATPISQRALRDGLVKPVTDTLRTCPSNFCLVALYIYKNVDFHWIRYNGDGTWSDKQGQGRAKVVATTKDPPPDLGVYKFCAYFCSPCNIQPPGLYSKEKIAEAVILAIRFGSHNPNIQMGASSLVTVGKLFEKAKRALNPRFLVRDDDVERSSFSKPYDGFYLNGTMLGLNAVIGDSMLNTNNLTFIHIFNSTIEVNGPDSSYPPTFFDDDGYIENFLQLLAIDQDVVPHGYFDEFASPTPSPEVIDSPVICFSGRMTVQVLVEVQGSNQEVTKQMKDLKVGDLVMVDGGSFEPVYSFGHYNASMEAEFIQLETSKGRTIELSRDHMVKVVSIDKDNDSLVNYYRPAGDVKVGWQLSSGFVTSIQKVRRHGVYSPFTISGNILVNSTVASTFVAFPQNEVLGVTYQWLAHSFEAFHRISYYLNITSKEGSGERYNENGVSVWVERPHSFAQWCFGGGNSEALIFVVLPIIVLVLATLVRVETLILWLLQKDGETIRELFSWMFFFIAVTIWLLASAVNKGSNRKAL